MAFRLFFSAARNLSIKSSLAHRLPTNNLFQNQLLKCETPIIDNIRPISFLQKRTGLELWDSVTSVSNAGKKRGRGRLAQKFKNKNLNQGQTIGDGRDRLILPGLNTPVKQGDKVMKQTHDKPDPAWNEKLYQLRDTQKASRRLKITHIERGYSGTKLAGRSVGPPEGQHFVEFDTRVIQTKMVHRMQWRGRSRRHSTFVVCGNGKGIAGIGVGKSQDPKSAIRLAKKHASAKLMHFQLRGRSIYHDFFAQFGPTKLYAYQMPEGFGLHCHRVIKTLCKLIGIKDLRTKCEGSTHPAQIVKAFLHGLLQQKTYDQMAEEKKMFLVQFSPNHMHFPKVVGRPSNLKTLRKADQIPETEIMDFKQYCFNGKIPLKRPPRRNGWSLLPTYEKYLKKKEKKRSWDDIEIYTLAKYGKKTSFLNEKYAPKESNENEEASK